MRETGLQPPQDPVATWVPLDCTGSGHFGLTRSCMPVQGCRPPEFLRREHPGSLALLDGRTQAGHRRVASEPVLSSSNTVTMVISTLYLPATTANIQHQPAPTGGVCAGQGNYPGMTSTVRWWLLVVAKPQVQVLRRPEPRHCSVLAARAQSRSGRRATSNRGCAAAAVVTNQATHGPHVEPDARGPAEHIAGARRPAPRQASGIA
jgi:hypothetical protein